MHKPEIKKVKPTILSFNQGPLLKQKLKLFFGYGLTENQKNAPGVVKFLPHQAFRPDGMIDNS